MFTKCPIVSVKVSIRASQRKQKLKQKERKTKRKRERQAKWKDVATEKFIRHHFQMTSKFKSQLTPNCYRRKTADFLFLLHTSCFSLFSLLFIYSVWIVMLFIFKWHCNNWHFCTRINYVYVCLLYELGFFLIRPNSPLLPIYELHKDKSMH